MEGTRTKLALLTSGGDAPGMNAAIRAVVRTAIACGCEPYAVTEGLRGLVAGEMRPLAWDDVCQISGLGGTVIGSSRCPEFMEPAGRRRAVHALVSRGIDRLVVIGGDGSLTGASLLRDEWGTHIASLVAGGEIGREEAQRHAHLALVGIAGSIDNDMAGTEMTIGASTSLHRIIEAVDCIHSTAASHRRAFIIEVMGRKCGWLALKAALCVAADWLLIPEDPPAEGWEREMVAAIVRNRAHGRTASIVIVAEGAVDREGSPIRSEAVRAIVAAAGLDARVTTLGHIQRGGVPSACDRSLATLQGVQAVEALLGTAPAHATPLFVGMNENRLTLQPLAECVERTREIKIALDERRFEDALVLRGDDFRIDHALWEMLRAPTDGSGPEPAGRVQPDGFAALGTFGSTFCERSADTMPESVLESSMRIALLNCGAPCGGMNAATAAIVMYGLLRGHATIGVADGFAGLLKGEARVLRRADVIALTGAGGSVLGTNRLVPDDGCMAAVVAALEDLRVSGLVIVGGFEAFRAALALERARSTHPALRRIPVAVIPATISNNVPGTEYSIGSDTALNVILQSCDFVRQSASSSRKRVFVIDVHGGSCGFLATMAALAAGATRSYIPEEGVTLSDLRKDARRLRRVFSSNARHGRLVIRNEKCHPIYSAELISRMLESESGGVFDSRWVVLGHVQQGGLPSPYDRLRATRLAILAAMFIEHRCASLSSLPVLSDPPSVASASTFEEDAESARLKTAMMDAAIARLSLGESDIVVITGAESSPGFAVPAFCHTAAVHTHSGRPDASPAPDPSSKTTINTLTTLFTSSESSRLRTAEDIFRAPLAHFLSSHAEEHAPDVVVIGIRGPRMRVASVAALERRADMSSRRPLRQWWLGRVRAVAAMLAYDPHVLRGDPSD